MLALAVGLEKAGHEVVMCTHTTFENATRERGIAFMPLSGDPVEVLRNSTRGESEEPRFSEIKRLVREYKIIKANLAFVEPWFRDCLAAASVADAIVVNHHAMVGVGPVIEKLGVPWCMMAYYPANEHMISGDDGRSLPKHRLVIDRVVGSIIHQIVRQVMKRPRREILGLPPSPVRMQSYPRDTKLLYAFSPAVFPPGDDWSDTIVTTGYWKLQPLEPWVPPRALVDFIEAGEPPIYIGFGSMPARPSVVRAIREAVTRSKRRFIFARGWSEALDLPDRVLQIDEADHDWLFPRMACVVHHGGAGTTAAVLRAGRPQVIVAFMGDQYLWGRRIHAMGAGSRMLVSASMTADDLLSAIDEALVPSVEAKAKEVSQALAREDGVAVAVSTLERWFVKNGARSA
jgi:sterol 3beta-glucosyltransferase